MPYNITHVDNKEYAAARRLAFAMLARQQETALMRAALRLCRSDHDRASALVLETLIRAYQPYLAGRFQDGPNAWPWLLRILTNLFINEHNCRKRWDTEIDLDRLTFSGEAGPAQIHAAPDIVHGVALLARTLDEELEAALAMLPDDLRLCIVLVDIEGLPYEDSAQVLGIPIGTVRSCLARARMNLFDLLWVCSRSGEGLSKK